MIMATRTVGGLAVGGLAIVALAVLAACASGPSGAAPTPPVVATATVTPAASAAVQAAIADWARSQAIDAGRIAVTRVEATEWPDASLGCPQPGRMYIQVITPGWRIQLTADGRSVIYHANQSGSGVVTCAQP
jgi:hypothetical protein